MIKNTSGEIDIAARSIRLSLPGLTVELPIQLVAEPLRAIVAQIDRLQTMQNLESMKKELQRIADETGEGNDLSQCHEAMKLTERRQRELSRNLRRTRVEWAGW